MVDDNGTHNNPHPQWTPSVDPAVWEELRKRFEELDATETGIDAHQRLCLNADVPEDLDSDHPDYTVSGGSELSREKYLTVETAAGIALGARSDEAAAGWRGYVIRDAVKHRSKWWQPKHEIVQLWRPTGRRVEITMEDTGRLNFLCQASCALNHKIALD